MKRLFWNGRFQRHKNYNMNRNHILDYFSGVDSPFKNKKLLSILSNFVWLLFFILLFIWPKQGFYFYVREQDLPLTYLFIFELTFVLIGYLNLKCGNGEVYIKMVIIRVKYIDAQETYSFNYQGIFWSLLHVSFLLAPFLPILLVASLLSGINISGFLISIAIIFQFSVVFRLIGVSNFLVLGNNNTLSYLISRLFFIFVTGFSWYLSPFINPIQIFITFHFGRSFGEIGSINYFYFLNGYLILLISVLSTIIFYVLRIYIKRERLSLNEY
jgi:hypothetical protein